MTTNSAIRFVFFGTPEIAVTALDKLEAGGMIPAAVVTRPDASIGRDHVLTASPVKEWAVERSIDVLQPEKITSEFIDELANSEWDLFVVVAYGEILPKRLIELPERGTINMHPSLLPRLRGPSPIESAILTDERTTGVTVMEIDEKMDHGPIIAQARVEIEEWPVRAPLLEGILAEEGASLLVEVIPEWVNGRVIPYLQDDALATYCPKITKEDGLLDLGDDPEENLRKIRAFEGWPGTYAFFERRGERIRAAILDAHVDSDGKLAIDTVKPEGKNEMPYADFLRGGVKPI